VFGKGSVQVRERFGTGWEVFGKGSGKVGKGSVQVGERLGKGWVFQGF